MSEIDVSTWKGFRVGDLFKTVGTKDKQQVPTGGLVSKTSLVEGSTSRITVTNVNNGVVGYYADINDANYRVFENFISVSFLGTVFYHKGRTSLDMKVHCLQLKDKQLSDNVGAFLVTILREVISGYSYAAQLSSKMLPDLQISLPATPSGEPDWDYMENYMKAVMEREEMFAEHLASLTAEAVADGHSIDVSAWHSFKLKSLFGKARHGIYTNPRHLVQDDCGLHIVSASTVNNGVSDDAYVGNSDKNTIPARVITWGKQSPMFAYQDTATIAGQGVYYYDVGNLTEYQALFVCAVMQTSISCRYNYQECLIGNKADEELISLPVTPSGEPDWDYMEQFMREKMAVAEYYATHLDGLAVG